jgi:dipeptidyl aminopeptidase/acylaminoacyl peptidase
MNILSRVAFATALCCAIQPVLAAELQPLENFARRPQMHGVTISADGRFVAFLSGSNDDTVLMTFDRGTPGSVFKRVTASEPGKFDIGWCRWANTRRLICGLYGNIRGSKYAELPFKRLFAVDADGAALKTLEKSREDGNMFVAQTSMSNFSMHEGGGATAIDKGTEPQHYGGWHLSDNAGFGRSGLARSYSAARQDELFDLTFEDADSVLIQLDDDGDSFNSIFQLDINTGARTVKVDENPPIRLFLSDNRGNARLGWGTRDLKTVYYARLDGDNEWRTLTSTEAFDPVNPLQPIAMSSGANTAYAVGVHEGRDSLWSIDLADQRAPQLLFHHPLVDVGAPILQTDRRLLGIRYDVDRPYVWYADPAQRELIERLERQFPGKVHEIVDSSADQNLLVIRASSDVDLGTYFLYDSGKQRLSRLGTAYPELDPKALGTMSYITYKAADGTMIPGYLTVPTGVEKKNLPLVVMPHDGPLARDSWEFSFLRTFLANRGYAVLQMNYRGSTGFGRKWMLDAKQDWGGLTYSDIRDGLRWAVGEGIADPKRICMVGWGFGGYASLLGAAREGAALRCAVSIAGITDLEMYQEHGSLGGEKELRRENIGTDREKLKANSPVELAGRIDIPVLLIHGTRDWQVQVDHTRAMARALKKHKKKVEEMIVKDGSHELERKSDRVKLLEAVEAFLGANLK